MIRGKPGAVRDTESLLQEPLAGGRVRCQTCWRRCIIPDGKTGWCGTRIVRGGRAYALTYGCVSSLSANPIEKKPFYHFYPGSYALTAGSWGCNFACPWCQNWAISKTAAGRDRFMTPEEFVDEALRQKCRGTSISFNEPTVSLEWSVDVFRTARQRAPRLYHTFVTNGYMTPEALKRLAEAGLDALNIDIKGDAAVYEQYCQADAERVWDSCRLSRDLGLHLEITTLVIPGVNDNPTLLRSIAERIVKDLGGITPWHVSAYYPAYLFNVPPTPASTMALAHRIGKEADLDFVYVGNLDTPASNTYCPSCGVLLVERSGFETLRCDLTTSGRCPQCGRKIPGVGWGWPQARHLTPR